MRKLIISTTAALIAAFCAGLGVSAAYDMPLSIGGAVISRTESRLLPPTGGSAKPTTPAKDTTTPKKAPTTPAATSGTVETAARPAGSLQALNAEKIAELRKKLSTSSFLSKIEMSVLEGQNAERQRLGLAPLKYDKDLQTAARQRSYELYKTDTFQHKRPDGRQWYTVLDVDVPYTYHKAGENLCTTTYPNYSVEYDLSRSFARDPDFWVEEWIDSPKHYETMIDPDYTNAGVGIFYTVKNGTVVAYATTLFSRPEK